MVKMTVLAIFSMMTNLCTCILLSLRENTKTWSCRPKEIDLNKTRSKCLRQVLCMNLMLQGTLSVNSKSYRRRQFMITLRSTTSKGKRQSSKKKTKKRKETILIWKLATCWTNSGKTQNKNSKIGKRSLSTTILRTMKHAGMIRKSKNNWIRLSCSKIIRRRSKMN